MGIRENLALLLLLLLSLSCGPSNAQVKMARAAEYPVDAYAEVFETCREVMVEQGYQLALVDPNNGLIVSRYQWYTKAGMRRSDERPTVRDGDAVFRIGVEIVPSARGIRVHVDGGAQGYTAGSPVAQKYEHGDPREPPWVEGKIHALQLAIYERLQARQLPVEGAAPAK